MEAAGRNRSGRPAPAADDRPGAGAGRPEVLILDDSASALDFATDAALRKAIKEKTEG